MTKKYNFSNEQVAEIMKIQKEIKNKNVDRRLRVLLLYSQGEKRVDIAEKTGYRNCVRKPIPSLPGCSRGMNGACVAKCVAV